MSEGMLTGNTAESNVEVSLDSGTVCRKTLEGGWECKGPGDEAFSPIGNTQGLGEPFPSLEGLKL
jgi:hypothetical protein